MPRFAFGKLAPDLPDLINGRGLIRARNMIPKVGGYGPVRGLAALDNATALDARPRGSISGIDAGGNGFLFAGDATKLYRQGDTGMEDVTRASGAYQLGETDRWDFTKFDETIYAVTPNEDMQYFTLGVSTEFAPVTNAPRARHVAGVGEMVMAGNIYDPQAGSLPDSISWSAYRNGLFWPVPGSNEAVSVQADRQPLRRGGGWIQDIVSGAEVSAIFQERAIHRVEYLGAPNVFKIDRVEKNVGMLVAHSGVAFERQVFFIAEDGFRIFDYSSSRNIGKGVINDAFLADLDRSYLDRVWVTKDPDRTLIVIAYPGDGNTGGQPNRILYYDYLLDRFSDQEIEVSALIENATETPGSIDAPESLPEDPDDLGDPGFEDPGGTPGYGDTSFDDRGTAPGGQGTGAFDPSFIASDFTGPLEEGLFETGDHEFYPGSRAFVSAIRPLVDGREAEVSVAGSSKRSEDGLVFGPWSTQDDDGKCPARADARYHRFRFRLPAGWDDAVGYDVKVKQAGEH